MNVSMWIILFLIFTSTDVIYHTIPRARARASNAELSYIQQERVELIIVLLKTPQI